MKKYLKLIACFALVAAISVGATLAYLQTNVGTKTNKFSSDKSIAGELTEPGWTDDFATDDTAWNYLPGEAHAKDPQITINKGSVDAYVAIKVEFFNDDSDTAISYDEFKSNYADVYVGDIANPNAGTVGFNKAWEEQQSSGNAMLFVYNQIVEAGTTTPNSLFDYVKVNDNIVDSAGNLPSFKIKVSGYAVQADNVQMSDAINQLTAMASN